jgi:hypothetical protein
VARARADLQGAEEQLTEKDLSSIGFLGYPLLQTADVIIYDAHFVPVGEDQVPHLELSREVVRRFNNFYGEVLRRAAGAADADAAAAGARQPEDEQELRQHHRPLGRRRDGREEGRQMYTDPKRVRADIPGTVEGNPVFIYHDAFNPNAPRSTTSRRATAPAVGDVEVKTKLAAAVNAMLDPMRERRARALARPGYLREMLVEGSRKARAVAEDTMERVRDAVKLRTDVTDDMEHSAADPGASEAVRVVSTPIRSSCRTSRGRSTCCCTSSRSNEVNVYDIPIALITEQYLDYLELMQELNLDVAASSW